MSVLNDIRLSKNFSLDEFCVSQTAARLGREIVPTSEQADRIEALVIHVLQPLRDAIKSPVIINSGLRPEWLNTAIGGSKNSQHMEGEAADFIVVEHSTLDAADMIVDLQLPFDQLIQEFGKWVHVSFTERPRRTEILTAYYDNGTKYKRGLV